MWSLQRVDASQSVAWTRTSDPLPLTRAHFEHADAAARDASLQRMFDVAEASLVDPWTRKRPPETRTLLLRHHEHLEGLSREDAQAALAAGGGEHQFPRELLLLANRMGVEVPEPKPKRAPVPQARAAAVADGDAPEPAPEDGGAASAEAAPAAEQPPEVAEAAAAPAETVPAEGGPGGAGRCVFAPEARIRKQGLGPRQVALWPLTMPRPCTGSTHGCCGRVGCHWHSRSWPLCSPSKHLAEEDPFPRRQPRHHRRSRRRSDRLQSHP